MSAIVPAPSEDGIVPAFWRALAARGWHRLSMRAVAAEAGVDLALLRRRFATPFDLLMEHERRADAAVLAGTVDDPAATARDRLFDVLMRRVDEIQPHRPGVERLLDDLPRAPLLALACAARLPVSMAWMLEAAGLEAAGPRGVLRVKGLGLVWLDTLRAWRQDGSADLSATMASLDRALDRADRAARWFGLDEAPLAPADAIPALDAPDPV